MTTARRLLATVSVLALTAALLLPLAAPAFADHTDPGSPLVPTPEEGAPGGGAPIGEGEWEFIANFPPNSGSDLWPFEKDGVTYAASGTLGQGDAHVGQRITQLVDADGEVSPHWVADHGSASCAAPTTSPTALQHDPNVAPFTDPELLFDSTDGEGRCHDPDGGGIEIIDISAVAPPSDAGSGLEDLREIHLTRHHGTTHSLTVDDERNWLVHTNNSDFTGANWLEFMDVRSCLTEDAGGFLPTDASLEDKRAACEPDVYRIPFEDEWTQQTTDGEGPPEGDARACHDTVVVDAVVFCSGVTGEVLIDTSDIIDGDGKVKGEPLDCEIVEPEGEDTGALVTDCSMWDKESYEEAGSPQAQGWQYMGHYNHPGITEGNTNLEVPSREGVAVSHETRPLPAGVDPSDPDRRFMVVSDERGGAVIPVGAGCGNDEFDEYWHGGLHFFDVTDPQNIEYATAVDEDGEEFQAFWRIENPQPQPTFCVVHRFNHIPDEQRLVMGYYSQGIRILDYEVDDQGRFVFEEVAAFMPEPAPNSWVGDVFHIEDAEPDGDGNPQRTYYLMSNDIQRGIDIMSWTGPVGPENTNGPTPPEMQEQRQGSVAAAEACPGNVPSHPYTDRHRIPPVHLLNVDCATHRDIVEGFRDGSYGPRLPVRRDQMASFIARMIDTAAGAQALPAAEESDDDFDDIDGNTHEDNIKRLYAAGVIEGRTSTRYVPRSELRRDQAATFVLRAAAYATGVDFGQLESDEQAFTDVGPDNTHFERVNGAAELDLVEGHGDGTYRPANSTERAQMASLVVRALASVEAETAGEEGQASQGAGLLAGLAGGLGGDAGILAIAGLTLLPVATVYGRRRRVQHAG